MDIQVKVIRLPDAAKIRRFAERQLGNTLARFSHFIHTASLHLDDINGPGRGGLDKRCRVVLHLRNQSTLVIEDLGSNSAQAVYGVMSRVQYAVAQQLGRLKKMRQRRETIKKRLNESPLLGHPA